MAVIVEDGSGVENAYSVLTETEITEYCTARGITLAENQASLILTQSMDVLLAFNDRYKGDKKHTNNLVPFPRSNFCLAYDNVFSDTAIPLEFKQAQSILAHEIARGHNFGFALDNRTIIEQQIGPLKRKWATPGEETDNLSLEGKYGRSFATAIIPLLRSKGNSGYLLKSARG